MATAKTSKKTICTVAGCVSPIQTRGMDARAALLAELCRKHYLQQKAGGRAQA